MIELVLAYREEIIKLISILLLPFTTFIIALGFVYVIGRMLEIVNSYKIKNVIALFIMIGSYYYYFFILTPSFSLEETIWYMIIYTSISVIFYVVLGFKFYERMDILFCVERIRGGEYS